MRNSRRIKRMSRNRLKIGKMNLTSLMDVFTILVFFLLVNSGSVELVEAPKDVKLPESIEEAFTELQSRMTAVAPLNGEGAIFASVRKMSIREADECAQLILGIYVELLRSGASLATVSKENKENRGDPAAVPAMLLKSV